MSDRGEHEEMSERRDQDASGHSASSAAPEQSSSLLTTVLFSVGATVLWLGAKLLGDGEKKSGAAVLKASRAGDSTLPPGCAECLEKARRGGGSGLILQTEPVSHEQIGAFLVGCSFLVALAGGIGFLVVYWTGGSNLLLGCTLACFSAALGVALVLWSHLLTLRHQVIEEREPLQSPPAEAEGAKDDFSAGADQIHRRGLLKWMVAGGLGVVGGIVVSLFRSLGTSPDPGLYSHVWKPGQRLVTLEGKPMRADALERGSTAIVFPEGSVGSEKAQTVLIKVDESKLRLPGDRSEWAPQGNLAFSRVCTHAGCAVGMYETTTHLLMCPCHQSTFDVLRAAEPTGGPADRALPQLPLYVDADGILRAGGGFSDIPGPGFWGMS